MKKQIKIGDLIIPSLNKYLKNRGFSHSKIITHWYEIAGEASDWSMPIKITFPNKKKDGGTIYIKVSSARATELQMLSKSIINKINIMFGYNAISKIFLHHGEILLNDKLENKIKKKDINKVNFKLELPNIKNTNLLNALKNLGSRIKNN